MFENNDVFFPGFTPSFRTSSTAATLMDMVLDPLQYGLANRYTHPTRAPPMEFWTVVQQPALPLAPSRQCGQRLFRAKDDIEQFLSSDLEISFASNVSLHSPPRQTITIASTPGSTYPVPMDISPAPPPKVVVTKHSGTENARVQSRPRAFTSAARLFGSNISNNEPQPLLPSPQLQVPKATAGGSTHSNSKKIQRSALPAEWFQPPRSPVPPEPLPENAPSSPGYDAMDVDTSYVADPVTPEASFEPVPVSAAPTVTDFNALFYETMSPRRSFETPSGPLHKKRRSLSPEHNRSTDADPSSSPNPPSSPSQEKVERLSNGTLSSRLSKPSLQGLGAPAATALKRPRRPVASAPVQPLQPAAQSVAASQYESRLQVAPVRRAFSAMLPPTLYMEPSSPESSFDGPELSSPAQACAKRQQVRTLRRCDGAENLRPLTATPSTKKETPKKFLSPGLPGFGDNEAHGKILPCRRVSEDGLMRISAQTLDKLLDGHYDSQITDYHIIDCRFDYEYNGGHIAGAVNINTTQSVEELLLGPSLTKPKASTSADSTRKTILVFHCEFSVKRAPTFAKHLRAKDRAMNNHIYPKIHYPEVYILEGGYCHYYKVSAQRCEPSAYVSMDDPSHAMSRREELDQFRKTKFGRHKSYAYGDGSGKTMLMSQAQQQQPQNKRNTVPASAPLFAAATAARTRRCNGALLSTLAEDGNLTGDADDTDTDIGDSPCPPPTKCNGLKGKKLVRGSLMRAETYGPGRMPY